MTLIWQQASGSAEGLQRMRSAMIVPQPCEQEPTDYTTDGNAAYAPVTTTTSISNDYD
jgi:hypothetical protein